MLLLLLLAAAACAADATVPSLPVGVNYGANADNLPSPAAVASFLATRTTINRVKLFDANPAFISAFANTPVSLAVSLPNSALPALADKATGLDAARQWVRSNLSPYVPATNVTLLLAGNEILLSNDRGLILALLPAMRRLAQALRDEGLPHVRVTTPHYLGILARSDGIPSNARFRAGYDTKLFRPMLQFHRDTGSPFMVNPYPYFSYRPETLDYALFRPNRGVYDPATRLNYTSMFEAQMDAIYTAMKRLGYGDVEIAVGEAGWPTQAEPGQVGVGVQEAREFNEGMIRVVSSGKGTPLMPNRKFETYVFSLFDEDLKPGPIAERHFGLFNPDFTPVYDVGLLRQGSMVHYIFSRPDRMDGWPRKLWEMRRYLGATGCHSTVFHAVGRFRQDQFYEYKAWVTLEPLPVRPDLKRRFIARRMNEDDAVQDTAQKAALYLRDYYDLELSGSPFDLVPQQLRSGLAVPRFGEGDDPRLAGIAVLMAEQVYC